MAALPAAPGEYKKAGRTKKAELHGGLRLALGLGYITSWRLKPKRPYALIAISEAPRDD
jgi:hypothetical protein